jgi:hypothetical protein
MSLVGEEPLRLIDANLIVERVLEPRDLVFLAEARPLNGDVGLHSSGFKHGSIDGMPRGMHPMPKRAPPTAGRLSGRRSGYEAREGAHAGDRGVDPSQQRDVWRPEP